MDIMYAIRISWEYTPIEFDFLLPANETCIFSSGSSQPCLTTGYIQLVYVERERALCFADLFLSIGKEVEMVFLPVVNLALKLRDVHHLQTLSQLTQ